MTRENEVPVIEARGISKYFGAVTALENVSLKLYRGEVLGVVGDNGAGKSTLMKILAGLYPPNAGEIFVEGKPVHFRSPKDARDMGIEMVYQDLALAGNMRIDENIFLGRERTRRFGPFKFIDNAASLKQAKEHLDKLKIEVKSVRQRVEELSGGQRQAVAIARATAFDAKVVIMDEPTAALAVKEVRKVLDLIKDLKNHGIGVILISHRLDDIFYVCDRVMALFHGRNFAEAPLSEVTRNDVIGWIMGNKSPVAQAAKIFDLN
ncbi:MAG: ATP-binding cassette domain-containing protein [Thermoflexales bacterium]|nr:ATP-binding cassette domain-containing protein [Thermoflexales bacterium]MCX7938410.1 ATP-binding cassette domain-containing protein [Thermoflexales bacterium]MDW8053806.1 ATP-binding cassette domain-containing protein [Anaerolineae bacterium]MDW8293280.1 ATP-binding cassette domain-containing protein [Anaerolineae bacterium]